MNWIAGLQRAIDYMEDHLEENLDCNEVARQACCSSFYFQRLFSMLNGMTVGEYIRSRRLSRAAEILASSDAKVLDVALRFGYDTPESFCRAFKTFHGCTPSMVRRKGTYIRSFSRMSTRLVIDGGVDMDYRIVKLDEFKVLERVRNFTTANGDNLKEIPKFWSELWRDGSSEILCRHAMSGELLGICYESLGAEAFPYSIAVRCADGTTAPDGFRVNTIPAHTWIVFKAVGALPDSIQQAWKTAFSQFFPSSEYQPTGEIDFEAYPDNSGKAPGEHVNELWISVEKK